jgi:hypothetical protein
MLSYGRFALARARKETTMAQDETSKEHEAQADTAELAEAELEKLAGGATTGGVSTSPTNPAGTILRRIGLNFHNY